MKKYQGLPTEAISREADNMRIAVEALPDRRGRVGLTKAIAMLTLSVYAIGTQICYRLDRIADAVEER